MKTRRIFALVSAATIALAGMPAHAVFAQEVDEIVAKDTTDDVIPVEDDVVIPEEPVEETSDDEAVAEPVEEASADELAEVETEETKETEETEEVPEEDADLAEIIESLEPDEDCDIEYIYFGNNIHVSYCKNHSGEAAAHWCSDSDLDGKCDICEHEVELVMQSGITINTYMNKLADEEDITIEDNSEDNSDGELPSEEYVLSNTAGSVTLSRLAASEITEDFDPLGVYKNLSQYEGYENVIASLPNILESGEIPTDTTIDLYVKDGKIDSFNISYEDTYVKENSVEESSLFAEAVSTVLAMVEEEPEILEEENLEEDIADLAEDASEESEDAEDEKDTSSDDTEVVAKEDEILPENVVVDDTDSSDFANQDNGSTEEEPAAQSDDTTTESSADDQ
jgi:hypothetical protein